MRTRWNWPRTTKRGCSNSVGAELAREHKPFYTSLLDGKPRFSGLGGGAVSHGKLPEEYHDAVDRAEYVVYSYDTPIGWINANHEVTIPDVGYSLTTSQHQYELIHAWRHLLSPGFHISARGRQLRPAGGGRRNGGMDDPYPPARYNGSGRGTVAQDRESVESVAEGAFNRVLDDSDRRSFRILQRGEARSGRSAWPMAAPGAGLGRGRSSGWTAEDDARLDRVRAELASLRRQMERQESEAADAVRVAEIESWRTGRAEREQQADAPVRRQPWDNRDPAGSSGYDRMGLPIDPQWDGGLG